MTLDVFVVAEFSSNNFDFQVMCLYAPNARDAGRQFLMLQSILILIVLVAIRSLPGQTIGPPVFAN